MSLDLSGGELTRFTAGGAGRCATGVTFPRARAEVLVSPGVDGQEDADALAITIRDVGALQERADRLRTELVDARARLEHLTGERRRFMGPACVRPHRTPGDWTGPVWLLDPRKNWDGFGFMFGSLALLWTEMPDLRPTGAGVDDLGPWISLASQPVRA